MQRNYPNFVFYNRRNLSIFSKKYKNPLNFVIHKTDLRHVAAFIFIPQKSRSGKTLDVSSYMKQHPSKYYSNFEFPTGVSSKV